MGVAHVTQRSSEYLGQKITIACLGGLVIDQKYRGQGIARALITKRLQIAREWNADIAFLNTDIKRLRNLFAKFGFVHIPRYTFIGKSGQTIVDNSGMVAPVCSHKKFEFVLNGEVPLFIGDGNL